MTDFIEELSKSIKERKEKQNALLIAELEEVKHKLLTEPLIEEGDGSLIYIKVKISAEFFGKINRKEEPHISFYNSLMNDNNNKYCCIYGNEKGYWLEIRIN